MGTPLPGARVCVKELSPKISKIGVRLTNKKVLIGCVPKPPKCFTSGMYSMRSHKSLESKIALKFNFKLSAILFLD